MHPSTRLILAAFAAVAPANALAANPYHILYRFTAPPNGVRPEAPLVTDGAGNFYGSTYTGGAKGFGTVFRLSAKLHGKFWYEKILFHFKVKPEGEYPQSALIFDQAGNLYGTTPAGGRKGVGVVFELTPPATGDGPWTETILHDFGDGTDGQTPYGGLIFGPDGSLYGTTGYGGSESSGAVFKLSPGASPGSAWTESVLYNFTNGADGGYPYAGLAENASGTLYGATLNGGNTGNGVVFSLTPPKKGANWTETVLHSFDASNDGVMPREALTIDPSGNLFGTTEIGGRSGWGVAYEVSPSVRGTGPWSEQVIYAFNADNGAGGPTYTNLLRDQTGTLYGTSSHPGEGTSNGSVFSLTPPARGGTSWSHKFLHKFDGGTDGLTPEAGLIFSNDGKLTGTTFFGGSGNQQGVVFQVTP